MALVPPVERDGFSFAGGDLFAEASGHNRHRRATPAELQAHFGTGSDKDRPAHWFEAQLIHYGLQPSKTKAVARMRLHDAVRAGGLAVPMSVQKLETELKKQWTKNEREAKKALGGASSSASTTTTGGAAAKKGTKRKAEETIDLTVSVGDVSIKVSKSTKSSSTTASAAAKKAKTTKSTTTTTTPKAKATKSTTTTPKPKATKSTTTTPKPKAPASASKPKSTSRAPSSSAPTPAKPAAKKQTARRGGLSQGPGRGAASSSSTTTATSRAPRTKQTARRSGAFVARGRIAGPASGTSSFGGGDFDFDHDHNGPPPPYSEYDNDGEKFDHNDGEGGYDNSGDDDDDDDDDVELRPLGLLNGRYAVFSPDVTSQWGTWDDGDFELVLTLSGSELWGRFDLGVVRGVLRLPRRPWDASHDRVHFAWRGREHEGPMLYGDRNGGWLRFLGDGRIEGHVDFMSLGFQAERLSGQGTRSEADIADLRAEWGGYNEREYEEENRARWY